MSCSWPLLNHPSMCAAVIFLSLGVSCQTRKDPNASAHLKRVNTQGRLLDSTQTCPQPTLSSAKASQYFAEIEKLAQSQSVQANRPAQVNQLRNPQDGAVDILVVGGGATGLAACLQGVRKGLRVACVDKGDFASGTSSRSTKLIHGGVRYLETAIVSWLPFKERKENIDLVMEGLAERRHFLNMAPHLTSELRIMTPVYGKRFESFIQQQYLKAGLLAYDGLAMEFGLQPTQSFRAGDAGFTERYGMLRTTAKEDAKSKLAGVVEYSDGQFNDARMAASLAMTALQEGGIVANRVEVTALLKNKQGKVVGATLKDLISGESFDLKSLVVINATGPGLDRIRLELDDADAGAMVIPKPGTHIVVDAEKMPIGDKGVLIPKAENGSVGFIKPFEGSVVIGTTEEPLAEDPDWPQTTEEHVEYLIRMANSILPDEAQISRADVKSVWTGIRPLVSEPRKGKLSQVTPKASRMHLIEVSKSGLVSIGGGKWTSFGAMGREVVEKAIQSANISLLQDRDADLSDVPLLGGREFHADLCHWTEERLQDIHQRAEIGLNQKDLAQIAVHLTRNYGTKAPLLLQRLEASPKLLTPLAPGYPYLEAEVLYGAQEEMAIVPADVLARRTRLAFVNHAAALKAQTRVEELLSEHSSVSLDLPAAAREWSQRELERMAPQKP